MRWRRLLPLLAIPPIGLALYGALRPPPAPPRGFVAVKTTFALPASDAYLLGAAALSPLNRGAPAEATFAEPVGSTKLRLRRAGATFDLCEVAVRRNRITSVTVVAVDNTMRCRIDA